MRRERRSDDLSSQKRQATDRIREIGEDGEDGAAAEEVEVDNATDHAGPSSSTNDAAGESEHRVESILSMKTVGGMRHFLVKWLGYDEADDNSWEPEGHLQGSQLLIRKFERERAAEAKEPRKGKGKAAPCEPARAVADDGSLELPPGWKCRHVEDERGARLQWSDAKAHKFETRERAQAAIQRWHERRALNGEPPRPSDKPAAKPAGRAAAKAGQNAAGRPIRTAVRDTNERLAYTLDGGAWAVAEQGVKLGRGAKRKTREEERKLPMCSACPEPLPLVSDLRGDLRVATLQSVSDHSPLCRKCAAVLLDSLGGGQAGLGMDAFVQQLGLEMVELPPVERLRVAPSGALPVERRSVIQTRVDKAARKTEKEVGSWLKGVISDVVDAAWPAGAPRRSEWTESVPPRAVANRLPRLSKAGSVEVLLPPDVEVGQKLRVGAHGQTFTFTVPAGVVGGQKLLIGLPPGITEAAALERARERKFTLVATRRFAAAGAAAGAGAGAGAGAEAGAGAGAGEASSSESAEERQERDEVCFCVERLVERVDQLAEAARREKALREQMARQQLDHQRRLALAAEQDTREKVGAWLGRLLTKVEKNVEKDRLRDEKRGARQAERDFKMQQQQAERHFMKQQQTAQAQLRQAEMLERGRRNAEKQTALHAEAAAKFAAKTARGKVQQPKRALPPGWHSSVDPSTGVTYYCNPSTSTTQWERPKASAPLSAAAGGSSISSALYPATSPWPQAAYPGAACSMDSMHAFEPQRVVHQQQMQQVQQVQQMQQVQQVQQVQQAHPWPLQQGSVPLPAAPSSLAWHTGGAQTTGHPTEMARGASGSAVGGRESGAGARADGAAASRPPRFPRVVLKLLYPPHLEHLRPKPRKPPPPRRPPGPPPGLPRAPPPGPRAPHWSPPYVPPPHYLPMPQHELQLSQPAAAAPPPAPRGSDWTTKLTLLLTTLRSQLPPPVFARVEQLVADMQSQRVQLNREQFLQQIDAITKS